MNGKPDHGQEVGLILAEEGVLRGDDLCQRKGSSAGNVQHPVVAHLVGAASNHSRDLTAGLQHAVIPSQEVLGGADRPS
jgi:hypothetical protein